MLQKYTNFSYLSNAILQLEPIYNYQYTFIIPSMSNSFHVLTNGYRITATLNSNPTQTLSFYAEPVHVLPDSFAFSADLTQSTMPKGIQAIFDGPLTLYQYIEEVPQNLTIEQQGMEDQNNPSNFFVVLFLVAKKMKKIKIASQKQFLSKQKILEAQVQTEKNKNKTQVLKIERLQLINKELQSITSSYLQKMTQLQSQNNELKKQLQSRPLKSVIEEYELNIKRLEDQKQAFKSQLEQLRHRPNKKFHLDNTEETTFLEQKPPVNRNKQPEISLGQIKKNHQQNQRLIEEQKQPEYEDFQPFKNMDIVDSVIRQNQSTQEQSKMQTSQDRFSQGFSAKLMQFIFQHCSVNLNAQNTDKPKKIIFQCFVCRKAFQDQNFLMRHFSIKHFDCIDEKWSIQDLKMEQKKYKVAEENQKTNKNQGSSGNKVAEENQKTNKSQGGAGNRNQIMSGFFKKYSNQ